MFPWLPQSLFGKQIWQYILKVLKLILLVSFYLINLPL